MTTSVLVFVLKCSVVLVVGTAAVPSQGKKTGEKKLRNVIITSFGEMPYEPVDSGGYYQSDVIPVNFNDEIQQQTMDVALRTGILVEDPNEKRTSSKENTNDEMEETSLKDETLSTNAKRQADSELSKEKTQSVKDEDEFLSPRVRINNRKSKVHGQPPESSNTFLSHPLSYGHEFTQRRKSHIPYRPYPSPLPNSYDENINREYYADLGEGWNLRDAEKILKGRNYNILVTIPDPYLGPHFRETPPLYMPSARHPLFYSLPNVEYIPGLEYHRGPVLHSSYVNHEDSRNQQAQQRISKNIDKDSASNPAEALPYTQTGYFNEDYYSGM